MASLEEIRKRFAKMNSADDGLNGNGNGLSSAAASALGGAALKIFDPLKKFEVQVSEITKIAEPLERVLNQTARTLDEIRVFSTEMERLAKGVSGPVELLIVEDGGHNANNRPYRYRSRTADWLAGQLGLPRI